MLAEILGLLATMAVGAVRRAPHLSLFPVLFWGTVAAGLYLRYRRHQTTRSDRVLRATVLVGVVAVAVGTLDLAVRGTVEIIHPCLVAYLTVPLGAGRRVLARLDAIAVTRRWRAPQLPPAQLLRAFGQRQTTYLTALLLDMALAAIAGDTYRLGARPVLDRADPGSLETVNWLHLTAFLFTTAIIIDTAVTITRLSGVHLRRR